jgi:hypothetical protein
MKTEDTSPGKENRMNEEKEEKDESTTATAAATKKTATAAAATKKTATAAATKKTATAAAATKKTATAAAASKKRSATKAERAKLESKPKRKRIQVQFDLDTQWWCGVLFLNMFFKGRPKFDMPFLSFKGRDPSFSLHFPPILRRYAYWPNFLCF